MNDGRHTNSPTERIPNPAHLFWNELASQAPIWALDDDLDPWLDREGGAVFWTLYEENDRVLKHLESS